MNNEEENEDEPIRWVAGKRGKGRGKGGHWKMWIDCIKGRR